MKKKSGFVPRMLGYTLLLLNIGAVVWLICCYMASVVPPYEVRNIALFSLTTPFAIAANFVFILIWLFSRKKIRFLISFVSLIFYASMIPALFGLHYLSGNDWSRSPRHFKLMSWNVHALGLFNPNHEKQHAQGIVDFIREEDPDILCVPEIAIHNNSAKNVYSRKIINNGHYIEYHFNTDNNYGDQIDIGTAIYSRYPFAGYKVFQLSNIIYMMQCDIRVTPSDTIRVCVVHLHSFTLTDEDKAIIEEVKKNNTEEIKNSGSFVYKFNEAYAARAKEAENVANILNDSPYPLVICGDFNDLPYSYTYRTIRGDLKDAFAEKGRGLGRTYNQIIPTLRIDHIFYDGDAMCIKAFKNPYSGWSDHSPVIANFEINDKAAN